VGSFFSYQSSVISYQFWAVGSGQWAVVKEGEEWEEGEAITN
jgi:hypothetical protein